MNGFYNDNNKGEYKMRFLNNKQRARLDNVSNEINNVVIEDLMNNYGETETVNLLQQSDLSDEIKEIITDKYLTKSQKVDFICDEYVNFIQSHSNGNEYEHMGNYHQHDNIYEIIDTYDKQNNKIKDRIESMAQETTAKTQKDLEKIYNKQQGVKL